MTSQVKDGIGSAPAPGASTIENIRSLLTDILATTATAALPAVVGFRLHVEDAVPLERLIRGRHVRE
jgi:hypothetical protein